MNQHVEFMWSAGMSNSLLAMQMFTCISIVCLEGRGMTQLQSQTDILIVCCELTTPFISCHRMDNSWLKHCVGRSRRVNAWVFEFLFKRLEKFLIPSPKCSDTSRAFAWESTVSEGRNSGYLEQKIHNSSSSFNFVMIRWSYHGYFVWEIKWNKMF